MIRHTVVFRLKWPPGSSEEVQFLESARQLAVLPAVQHFEVLRQIGKKNDFRFGFSMEFADDTAYQSYNNHPVHQAFVKDQWTRDVEEFMEIDYMIYSLLPREG